MSAVADGLKIIAMDMKDADNGEVQWSSTDWKDVFTKEITVNLPSKILGLRAISREMTFASQELIQNFRLVQSVRVFDQPIEEWNFRFGFVIPNSVNTWQCTIEAAGGEQMLTPEMLSGNLTIITHFYDGDDLLCVQNLRVNYV